MHHSNPTMTGHATHTAVPIVLPREQQEPVLIVVHHDGYLEAFSEKHVNVQLFTLPFAGWTAEAERLAEAYVERQLSKPFRDIFFPGLRTTLGRPLSARPSDIAARGSDLALLRGLQACDECNGHARGVDGLCRRCAKRQEVAR